MISTTASDWIPNVGVRSGRSVTVTPDNFIVTLIRIPVVSKVTTTDMAAASHTDISASGIRNRPTMVVESMARAVHVLVKNLCQGTRIDKSDELHYLGLAASQRLHIFIES